MKQKVNKPGFLLIELLVALSLIGSLSIIMSGVYVHVMRQQARANDIIQATEYLTYYAYAPTTHGTTFPLSMGKFMIYRSNTEDSVVKNFAWVTITVSWPDKTAPNQKLELSCTKGVQQ